MPTTTVPTTVRVPVTIRIGDTEVRLGTTRAAADVADLDGYQLGHLLRIAAELVDGQRHEWPRQRWCVGDRVRLPRGYAYGRITQVDAQRKTYLVDCGAATPAEVWWGALDDPLDLDVDTIIG